MTVDIDNPHSFEYFLGPTPSSHSLDHFLCKNLRVTRFDIFRLHQLRLRQEFVRQSIHIVNQRLHTGRELHSFASMEMGYIAHYNDFFLIFANDSPQLAHRHFAFFDILAAVRTRDVDFKRYILGGMKWMGKRRRHSLSIPLDTGLVDWPAHGCNELGNRIWAEQALAIEALEELYYE